MIRVGFGCDVHPFDETKPLFLGGVFFPSSVGLKGHSDADVVLHALCDSLLGAVAMGDIGEHFPDTDARYKNKESSFFLQKVVQLLRNDGFSIVNIDITILAEKPKIMEQKKNIRVSISKICDIDLNQVSVKATTTEKLGFVGREEGIMACAVSTITSGGGNV